MGFIAQSIDPPSLYFSESKSDIDICVYATPEFHSNILYSRNCLKLSQEEQQIHFLHELFLRAIDSLASEKKICC